MIKAVIFDLDGTLLDRDASLKSFVDAQYERFKSRLEKVPKSRYVERFIELDARGMVWKDRVYQQMAEEFALPVAWEVLLEDYMTGFKQHCIPFPNLKFLLEQLKGRSLRLGIISNGKGQFQLDAIQALGIETYMDVILISEWEGMKKPDPNLFKKALARLGVASEEAMYVGDHLDNDIKGARAAGIKTIWKRDFHWSSAEADYIIEDLAEIAAIAGQENLRIRRFQEADLAEVVALFYGTVHTVNAADYSGEQLAAWAPKEEQAQKAAAWRKSLQQNISYVAEMEGKIAGFCDMTEDGYLNRLYVHKNYQRQGIATHLVGQLEQEAKRLQLTSIFTDASLTAKPFFEGRGYRLVREQTVERRGVVLPNCHMQKKLSSG
ncbi:HAD superfamily hydrolase (TIGR01549 family) [Planomicrobium sp. HSC-17F08]|uniref:GNAT family N-acetyltransferase n=1 Tax=Planococcus liqunii TaxID=3058394 RepID=UPI002A09ABA5|nr:HAD superfamily hydrolase (TIGR01549 family) [Planomicrobium sp. HSC-17F08]